MSEQRREKMGVGLWFFPFVMIFIGLYVANLAFEFCAFYNFPTTTTQVKAKVVYVNNKQQNQADVDFGIGAGDTNVWINHDLYAKLQPWKFPGRDCLLLSVQTGRWGLRRVLFPNFFDRPLGMERYRLCHG
ncbi:MAG: hypothetical protein ABIS10_07955 [Novosphingobium sp.]